ncbi:MULTISPECIES: hypothetical protein [unclassified Caballeronia]|uniref:hypothetical protein n=1 Tax=unclassified Caballeronia TaxID=2646786 RepID=UPI00158E8F82|nr:MULTISPECIES: hypothetical protein [unclassified Caballeronia]QSN63509.1 hypothetical protein JYK05_14910 [Caballeronia sp. M1242]
MANLPRILTALTLLALVSACETTGDPRQGGLFGWSATQADERQRALEQQAAQAQKEARREQAKVQQSSAKEGDLQAQVDSLHNQLKARLAENTRLSRQLTDLTRNKKLATSDLERVRRELSQNQQVRQAAMVSDTAPAGAMKNANNLINEQNKRLGEEVMFLLQP